VCGTHAEGAVAWPGQPWLPCPDGLARACGWAEADRVEPTGSAHVE
jgi:hypothetical protein